MRAAILPLCLMIFGSAWFIAERSALDSMPMLWSAGLFCAGLAVFGLSGFHKESLVLGGFLIAAAPLSLLRQQKLLTIQEEFPLLLILFGLLWLISKHPLIPATVREPPDGSGG